MKKSLLIFCLMVFLALPAVSMAVDACTQQWETGASMPTARYRTQGVAYNNQFYAFGGMDGINVFDDNESYDYWTDSWTTNTPMPATYSNFCVAVWEDRIYLIGGYDGDDLNYFYAYNPEEDIWDTSLAQLPAARTGMSCASYDGKLYAAGGYGYSDLYIYDIAADSWSTGASMPTAIGYAAGFALDGTFYVAGGWDMLATVYEYNIAGDSWSLSSNAMNVGVQSPAYTSMTTPGGLQFAYIMGGGQVWVPTDTFLQFIPGFPWSDFTSSYPLPETRWGAAGGSLGFALFFAAGGGQLLGTPENDLFIFNPCGGYIRETDPMYAPAGQTTSIDLVGLNFDDTTTFTLDDGADTTYDLTGVTIASTTEASATVPATVPVGVYDLWVYNSWAISPVYSYAIEFEVCECVIDDGCYADGDTNPDNVCQICTPATSATTWSDNDGETCDDGLWCTENDSCSGGACDGDDRDCDDGDFCTGVETCNEDSDSCDSPGDPCADDGQFCNGTESCNEDADSCMSTGDPCEEDETCNEDSDSCDPATDDDDTADDDDTGDDDATDDDATDDDDIGSGDDDDDDDDGCCGC